MNLDSILEDFDQKAKAVEQAIGQLEQMIAAVNPVGAPVDKKELSVNDLALLSHTTMALKELILHFNSHFESSGFAAHRLPSTNAATALQSYRFASSMSASIVRRLHESMERLSELENTS